MNRMLVVALVAVIVAAVAGSAALAYVWTRPQSVPLTVASGFMLGVIEGNLTTLSSVPGLILAFDASSYANQSTAPSSRLTMHVWTDTFYVAGTQDVEILINMTLSGDFTGNLRPSSLDFTANQTGPDSALNSWPQSQGGANVSFDPSQKVVVVDNGSGTLRATLVGQTGGNARYSFSYQETFKIDARPAYNRFVGLRATVGGLSVPVAVTVLLKVINDAGGIWA